MCRGKHVQGTMYLSYTRRWTAVAGPLSSVRRGATRRKTCPCALWAPAFLCVMYHSGRTRNWWVPYLPHSYLCVYRLASVFCISSEQLYYCSVLTATVHNFTYINVVVNLTFVVLLRVLELSQEIYACWLSMVVFRIFQPWSIVPHFSQSRISERLTLTAGNVRDQRAAVQKYCWVVCCKQR